MFCLSRRLLGAVLLTLSTLGVRAQDSTLTRLIGRNQYPLQASGATFSGLGWDKLLADVRHSQFVLVGEDHGIAQIPLFTAAVAREFRPAVYVAEIDPYVATTLTQFAAQPGPPTAYLRRYPGALCFYSLAEEFELVRQLRAQQAQLVGLDQVFITNAAPTYRQLAEQVKNQAARTYFARQAVRYEHQAQAGLHAAKPSFVMTGQSRATIDSLLLLTKTEGPAIRQLAQDYAASYRIYATGSHQARLNLMKHNLLLQVRPYQTATGLATPKMLFKFGALHVARGASPVKYGEFYDVGNLVQNLADVQTKQSLHLLVLGKQGAKVAGVGLLLANQPAETYTPALYEPQSALPVLPFMDKVTGPAWSVFDLRPLREALTDGKLQVPNQSLQRTLMGFDYLLVIPETTASHPL